MNTINRFGVLPRSFSAPFQANKAGSYPMFKGENKGKSTSSSPQTKRMPFKERLPIATKKAAMCGGLFALVGLPTLLVPPIGLPFYVGVVSITSVGTFASIMLCPTKLLEDFCPDDYLKWESQRKAKQDKAHGLDKKA